MAYNDTPTFGKIVRTPSVAVTAANTSSQGGGTIGTDTFLIYTAPPEGAYLRKLTAVPTSSVAATATTATVGRVFKSTQSSGATTSANTDNLGKEHALASQTAAQTTTPVTPIEIPLGIFLAGNLSLLVTNHAAPAANTQWKYTLEAIEPTV